MAKRMVEVSVADKMEKLNNAFEVDESGNATFGADVEVDGDVVVNGAENIVDKDGNELILPFKKKVLSTPVAFGPATEIVSGKLYSYNINNFGLAEQRNEYLMFIISNYREYAILTPVHYKGGEAGIYILSSSGDLANQTYSIGIYYKY